MCLLTGDETVFLIFLCLNRLFSFLVIPSSPRSHDLRIYECRTSADGIIALTRKFTDRFGNSTPTLAVCKIYILQTRLSSAILKESKLAFRVADYL